MVRALAASGFAKAQAAVGNARGFHAAAERGIRAHRRRPGQDPRSVVVAAAWLARSQVAAGDLDRAVPTTQAALNRLPTVRSRRCTLILRRLEDDLAALPPARRPAAIRALHDQLRAT
ncbi:MAG: hypothetical protein ACRDRP_23925 [Pseudonocardiaceae bacterium]